MIEILRRNPMSTIGARRKYRTAGIRRRAVTGVMAVPSGTPATTKHEWDHQNRAQRTEAEKPGFVEIAGALLKPAPLTKSNFDIPGTLAANPPAVLGQKCDPRRALIQSGGRDPLPLRRNRGLRRHAPALIEYHDAMIELYAQRFAFRPNLQGVKYARIESKNRRRKRYHRMRIETPHFHHSGGIQLH